MAFNPFHTFRKHQKVIFAVLTIICMFVFILQFGRGDITTWLMGGGGQGKGEKVVTLYGRDLYTNDLTLISKSRQLANEFIFTALLAAQTEAAKDFAEYKPEKPDAADEALQRLSEERFKRFSQARTPDDMAQIARQSLRELDALRGLSAPADNSRRNRAIEDLGLLYRFEFFRMAAAANPFYFGGGVKTDELLDFEIWKHQAEKLGIVLTKADIRRAVAHEAANHDLPSDAGGSWAAEPAFKEWFAGRTRQNGASVPEDLLVKAVGDEFRVMIAKQLVAGRAAGVPGLAEVEHNPPDLVTPYDFWKFYRDNRTTIKVAVLPIPVESFLAQVPSDPSEKQLKDLYLEYKGVEPDPASSTPGFKEPHRIKIQRSVAAASPLVAAYLPPALLAVRLARSFRSAVRRCTALGGYLAGGGVAPRAVLAGIADKGAAGRRNIAIYLGRRGSDDGFTRLRN